MPASNIVQFPVPRVVPPAPPRQQSEVQTFRQPGCFAAMTAAEQVLRAGGFSVGPMQGNFPRGIRFGRCVIAKWNDMGEQRLSLHGRMSGDMIHGPVTVEIYVTAPAEAQAAFSHEEA